MHFPRWLLVLTHFVFESGWSQKPHAMQPTVAQPNMYSHGLSVPRSNYYKQSSSGSSIYIDDSQISKEPEFITHDELIEVVLGDTVILPCKISNIGDSVVLWKQGERVISAGPIQVRKDPRFALVEAASLRISDVVVADTGNYTCEVEWRGQPRHIIHQLVVLVSPTIWAVLPGGPGQNRPVEAREGSSVQLECQADGIPPPVIRWRRQNGDYLGPGSVYPQGPTLQIPVVRKEHAGTYMCTASNNVGTMSAAQIELKVLFPPEISSGDRTVYSGPGGKADLKCTVKAEPRANISWYLDGRRVQTDRRHQIEEHGILVMLRIVEMDIQDLGNYSCQADNSQGVARDHIEVSGKPQIATINSSPEGLHCNSYNLTWSVKSYEQLTKVRILFRKMDRTTINNENSTWNNLMLSIQPGSGVETSNPDWSLNTYRHRPEIHIQHHQFQNLDADSRYEVIIQSKNRFGWSEPTKSFIFSTRITDYSPMASYPGLHGGLISSGQLIRPSSMHFQTMEWIVIAATTRAMIY